MLALLRHLEKAGFAGAPRVVGSGFAADGREMVTYKAWFGRELPGSQPVIGHCDTGPWNITARDGRPAALVDFEFAGPVDAIWELAQAAWLNAHLYDTTWRSGSGCPVAPGAPASCG